jgi:serine/threonine-protein kinase
MSPEQLVGWTIDARSDIYSAGVLLFELTTGRRPYPAEDPLELATQIATTDVPEVTSVAPAVPRMLSDVIRKALAPVPASRFQSAQELGAALARLAPEPHQDPAPAPAPAPRIRARVWLTYIVAALVIALLIASVAALR